MPEQLAKVIDLFKPPMSASHRAHIMQRAADLFAEVWDMDADIAQRQLARDLKESEYRRLKELLGEGGDCEQQT